MAANISTERDELVSLNTTLLRALECPVCLSTCGKAIFMCSNGHNVCSPCKRRLVGCPVCRNPNGARYRNKLAEELTKKLLHPCTSFGCDVMVTRGNLPYHLEMCLYNHKCRIAACKFAGGIDLLGKHFDEVHSDVLLLSSSRVEIVNILALLQPGENSRPFKSDNGQLFWVCFNYNVEMSTVHLYIRLIGLKNGPVQYLYKIKIGTDDGLKSHTYKDLCLDEQEDVLDADLCMERELLLKFDTMQWKVRIM